MPSPYRHFQRVLKRFHTPAVLISDSRMHVNETMTARRTRTAKQNQILHLMLLNPRALATEFPMMPGTTNRIQAPAATHATSPITIINHAARLLGWIVTAHWGSSFWFSSLAFLTADAMSVTSSCDWRCKAFNVCSQAQVWTCGFDGGMPPMCALFSHQPRHRRIQSPTMRVASYWRVAKASQLFFKSKFGYVARIMLLAAASSREPWNMASVISLEEE